MLKIDEPIILAAAIEIACTLYPKIELLINNADVCLDNCEVARLDTLPEKELKILAPHDFPSLIA